MGIKNINLLFLGNFYDETKIVLEYSDDHVNKKFVKYIKENSAGQIPILVNDLSKIKIKLETVESEKSRLKDDYIEAYKENGIDMLLQSCNEMLYLGPKEWMYPYDIEITQFQEIDEIYILLLDNEIRAYVKTQNAKCNTCEVRLRRNMTDNELKAVRKDNIITSIKSVMTGILFCSFIAWVVYAPISNWILPWSDRTAYRFCILYAIICGILLLYLRQKVNDTIKRYKELICTIEKEIDVSEWNIEILLQHSQLN